MLETLVAISVLMIVISSAFGLLPEGLTGARFAKNQTTASYLALEAMEVVTNLRDNAMFFSPNLDDPMNWLKNLDGCVDDDFDALVEVFCTANGIENTVHQCTGEACPPLYFIDDPFEGAVYGNGGMFDENSTAEPTFFTRYFSIILLDNGRAPVGDGTDIEALVRVVVTWNEGGSIKRTVAQKNIFDWNTFNK